MESHGLNDALQHDSLPCEIEPINADDNECIICLAEFVDPVVLKACRHRFCFKCLKEWQRMSNKCPTCRSLAQDAESELLEEARLLLTRAIRLKHRNSTDPDTEAILVHALQTVDTALAGNDVQPHLQALGHQSL